MGIISTVRRFRGNFAQKARKDFFSKSEKQSESQFIKQSFKHKTKKSHFKYEWRCPFLSPRSSTLRTTQKISATTVKWIMAMFKRLQTNSNRAVYTACDVLIQITIISAFFIEYRITLMEYAIHKVDLRQFYKLFKGR